MVRMDAVRHAGPVFERRVVTSSPEHTLGVARSLGAALAAEARTGFAVLLGGDLGAGKTVFVRGLARGLGLPERVAVTSPTFTLAQRFDLDGGLELHHLDVYRLRGVDDLEATGFEETVGEGRVTCVEWGERVAEALPPVRLEVVLASVPAKPESRAITLTARGARLAAVLRAWAAPAAERP
jgi:tRNA threonylcarbamoyladenosine biosynthesis protein TsaE